MRARLLFLAKFLACSLLLYAAWRPFSALYAASLCSALDALNHVRDFVSAGDAAGIGEMSKLLIPFVSLIIVSPGLRPAKKTTVIALGSAVFWTVDLLWYWSFAYLVATQRMPVGSPLFLAANAVVLTIKWLIPFLFGVLPDYPYLRGIFGPLKSLK